MDQYSDQENICRNQLPDARSTGHRAIKPLDPEYSGLEVVGIKILK